MGRRIIFLEWVGRGWPELELEGWGCSCLSSRFLRAQRGSEPAVGKFPDEAVALRLPVEVAVALHFAEGMAVGTRDQESTR